MLHLNRVSQLGVKNTHDLIVVGLFEIALTVVVAIKSHLVSLSVAYSFDWDWNSCMQHFATISETCSVKFLPATVYKMSKLFTSTSVLLLFCKLFSLVLPAVSLWKKADTFYYWATSFAEQWQIQSLFWINFRLKRLSWAQCTQLLSVLSLSCCLSWENQ